MKIIEYKLLTFEISENRKKDYERALKLGDAFGIDAFRKNKRILNNLYINFGNLEGVISFNDSDFSWNDSQKKINEAKSVMQGKYNEEHKFDGIVIETERKQLTKPRPPYYLKKLIEEKDKQLFELFGNASTSPTS